MFTAINNNKYKCGGCVFNSRAEVAVLMHGHWTFLPVNSLRHVMDPRLRRKVELHSISTQCRLLRPL